MSTKNLTPLPLYDVLAKKCPEEVKELSAAFERMSSGEPEVLAQALTSCRRFLKDFADVVYPPSKEVAKDGKGIER